MFGALCKAPAYSTKVVLVSGADNINFTVDHKLQALYLGAVLSFGVCFASFDMDYVRY